MKQKSLPIFFMGVDLWCIEKPKEIKGAGLFST